MPCSHCQNARRATANALKAAVSGNLREAAQSAKEAGQHLAAKVDEAARVRARLTRRS